MSSPASCPLCCEDYNFDNEHRPMSLSCGHTVCLECVPKLNKKCATCRTIFTSSAPNYLWSEVSAPSSPTTSQAGSKNDVKESIEAITLQAAAKKLEVDTCDAALQKAEKKLMEVEERLVKATKVVDEARGKAVAAHEELEKLNSALLPLKLSLGLTDSPRANSPAARSASMFSNPARTGSPGVRRGSVISKPISSSAPDQIEISNCNLGDVLEKMNLSSRPATYNFQGMDMKYSDRGDPRLTSQGVTWRNGKITLGPSMKFILEGSGVNLEGITFSGGAQVLLQSDASVTMTDCVIRDMITGIVMQDNSYLVTSNVSVLNCTEHGLLLHNNSKLAADSLSVSKCTDSAVQLQDSSSVEARDLKIFDCSKHGVLMLRNSKLVADGMSVSSCAESAFQLQDSSSLEATDLKVIKSTKSGLILFGSASIKLTDSEVNGAKDDGISMHDTSNLVGTRLRITGVENNGLSLSHKSKASLTSCTIRGNPGFSGGLWDEASLIMSCCAVDGEFGKVGASTVEIRR